MKLTSLNQGLWALEISWREDFLERKESEMNLHPVQTTDHKGGKLRTEVTLRAYEVYSHVYAPQEAMIVGNCRGGFGTGEIIAFLIMATCSPPA